jgi:hypothetical protein
MAKTKRREIERQIAVLALKLAKDVFKGDCFGVDPGWRVRVAIVRSDDRQWCPQDIVITKGDILNAEVPPPKPFVEVEVVYALKDPKIYGVIVDGVECRDHYPDAASAKADWRRVVKELSGITPPRPRRCGSPRPWAGSPA